MQRKNIIGQKVREARKEAHVTQMELAAQMQLMGIKIDRSGIAKIELGLRPITDIEIVAIKKILKVPVDWLFQNSKELFNP